MKIGYFQFPYCPFLLLTAVHSVFQYSVYCVALEFTAVCSDCLFSDKKITLERLKFTQMFMGVIDVYSVVSSMLSLR